MSKQNYTNYSKQRPVVDVVEPVVEEVASKPEVQEVTEEVVAESKNLKVEEVVEATPEPVYGIVVDCTKLNVRKNPDYSATPVVVLKALSKVEVDLEKSNNIWYKVKTVDGIEGYCMRKYISVRQ